MEPNGIYLRLCEETKNKNTISINHRVNQFDQEHNIVHLFCIMKALFEKLYSAKTIGSSMDQQHVYCFYHYFVYTYM